MERVAVYPETIWLITFGLYIWRFNRKWLPHEYALATGGLHRQCWLTRSYKGLPRFFAARCSDCGGLTQGPDGTFVEALWTIQPYDVGPPRAAWMLPRSRAARYSWLRSDLPRAIIHSPPIVRPIALTPPRRPVAVALTARRHSTLGIGQLLRRITPNTLPDAIDEVDESGGNMHANKVVRHLVAVLGLMLSALTIAGGQSALGASPPGEGTTATWQQAIAQSPTGSLTWGCYQTSYPSLQWHDNMCKVAPEVPFAPAPLSTPANSAPANSHRRTRHRRTRPLATLPTTQPRWRARFQVQQDHLLL